MNPWAEIQAWLTDRNPDSSPPESANSLNYMGVISMFARLGGGGTIYLNKLFNRYDAADLPVLEILPLLKRICLDRGLQRYQLSSLRLRKEKLEHPRIAKRIPYIKSGEIPLILKWIEDSPEQAHWLEWIGLEDRSKRIQKDPEPSRDANPVVFNRR